MVNLRRREVILEKLGDYTGAAGDKWSPRSGTMAKRPHQVDSGFKKKSAGEGNFWDEKGPGTSKVRANRGSLKHVQITRSLIRCRAVEGRRRFFGSASDVARGKHSISPRPIL